MFMKVQLNALGDPIIIFPTISHEGYMYTEAGMSLECMHLKLLDSYTLNTLCKNTNNIFILELFFHNPANPTPALNTL